MNNFFNFNFSFPFGMSNWLMPTFTFPRFYPMFQMPIFNIFSVPYLNFNLNTFNLSPPQFNHSIFPTKQADNTDTFTSSSKKTKQKYFQTDDLKLDDYNATKGNRLASIALGRSTGWSGYCAAYVKSSIQAANLGSYKYGHAYQMPSILRNNKNFKEISTEGVDVSKLPAGCVLVYDKGTEGYSKKYGHTEITTGDGRAVSDGITKNLHKKPSNIFIPV